MAYSELASSFGALLQDEDSALWARITGTLAEAGFHDLRLLALQAKLDPDALLLEVSGLPTRVIPIAVVAAYKSLLAAAQDNVVTMSKVRRADSTFDRLNDILVVQRKTARSTGVAPSSSSAVGYPLVHWRPGASRAQRRKILADGVADGLDVAQKNEADRVKWTERMVKLLQAADVPSWQQAQITEDAMRAMEGLAGLARPSTLRLPVRAWERP